MSCHTGNQIIASHPYGGDPPNIPPVSICAQDAAACIIEEQLMAPRQV